MTLPDKIAPGVYYDIANDDYHNGPGISKSHLDDIQKTPMHYWDARINPEREPKEKTPALILGDAIHKAVLEPDLFPKFYFGRPGGIDGRTKAGKEILAGLEAEHAGKIMLSEDDFKTALKVRDAAWKHPVASRLLKNGRSEVTFYAIDGETGELVKCRTDRLHESGMVVDLKTTEDASEDAFNASIRKYRYFVQDPWYCDVIKGAIGESPNHFVFIALEKTRPCAVGVYYLEQEDIDRGRRVGRANLRTISHYRKAGFWPGYTERAPKPLGLSPWARHQIDETYGIEQ